MTTILILLGLIALGGFITDLIKPRAFRWLLKDKVSKFNNGLIWIALAIICFVIAGRLPFFKSLFLILALLSIMGFFIGLFKSNILQPIFKKKSSTGLNLIFFTSATIIFFIIFGLIPGNNKSSNLPSKTETKTNTQKVIYDIPAVVNKNADEAKVILGTPKSQSEPTQQQLDAGVDTGEIYYEKDGQNLLITYIVKTKAITDFFLDGNDKNKLLASGNLNEKSGDYLISEVQQLDDKSKITGIKIAKKLPKELDGSVNYNALALKITNNEINNWFNCKFKLNEKYEYRTDAGVKAKDSVIVSFSEFTKSDGTRFNLLLQAPQSLYISCDTNLNNLRYNFFSIK